MAKLRDRAAEWLKSPHAPELAAGVAVLLALPSLLLGEMLDDHLLRAAARNPERHAAWDLFTFARPGEVVELRERGWVGWWAPEDFEARMMRPLSSLTHAFDYALWPDAAWLMHLENVLLYALLTWLVARLIQKVHGPGLVAGIAALVFAIDESHALTVMWIAGRNTMLAALFGILAVHAHLRWREVAASGTSTRTWPFAIAGPLCFTLALASGEAGLCSFGYVLAWTLVRERKSPRGWLALVPYLAVILVWRIVYVAYGFGVTGSSLYLDVGAEPLTFVGRAAIYPPSLAMAQLSLPVTDLLLMVPASWIALTLMFAALVWALGPVLRTDEAKFWMLGMLFAAVPLAATIPTARLLLLVGTGGAAIVGLAFVGWRERVFLGFGRRVLVGLILFGNLILAPLAFVPYGVVTGLLEAPHLALAEQLPADADVCVVLNVPSEINGLYSRAVRERDGGRWPDHVYTLYVGRDLLEVERVDATTLELRSEAGWAAEPIDRFARDWRAGFEVGERVELERASVEVLEVGDEGRPRRIRVHFDRDLDELDIYGFDPQLERWQPAIGEVATFTAAIGQG
jgi:hypothetical protein